MKSLLALPILFILLFTQSSAAQEKMVARDGFKEGFRAVQFGISNNFTLSDFDGSRVSYLKFKSPTKARFYRFSFSTFYNKTERDQTIEQESQEIRFEEDDTYDARLRLNIGNQVYVESNSDILPYITKSLIVGMNIRYTNDESLRQISTLNTSDDFSTEVNGFTPVIGGSLGLGFDYFIAKNISITAYTSLDLEYSYYINETDNLVTSTSGPDRLIYDEVNSHTFSLGLSNVVFGLTAYF